MAFVGLPGTAWLLGQPPRAGAAPAPEYQVKAAFIFNFLKFIEWPPERFPRPGDPIIVGVIGQNPFENDFAQQVRGRPVGGREVVIREFRSAKEAQICHLAFISRLEDDLLPGVRQELAHHPTVTVGENEAFGRAEGIIRFVIKDSRLRYVVNLGAAKRAGVRLNQQLLRHALEIIE